MNNCMTVTLERASVDAISVSIASLVKGALSAMIIDKLKWAGAAALAIGFGELTGAVAIARQGAGFGGDQKPKNPAIAKDRMLRAAAVSAGGLLSSEKTPAMESREVDGLRNRLIQAAKRTGHPRSRTFK